MMRKVPATRTLCMGVLLSMGSICRGRSVRWEPASSDCDTVSFSHAGATRYAAMVGSLRTLCPLPSAPTGSLPHRSCLGANVEKGGNQPALQLKLLCFNRCEPGAEKRTRTSAPLARPF